MEVQNTWNDFLKDEDKSNHHEGRQLYITRQRPKDVEKRYATMGKLASFVESEADGTFRVKKFWAPDFAVYAERDKEPPIHIADIAEDSSVKWHVQGLKVINKPTAELATAALATFWRRRLNVS